MFDLNYEVLLADSEESKNFHFNIRYQVYCHEKGFESASQFHDTLEVDGFDEHSVHFIVRCKKTGDWVAAMRLVSGGEESLPFSGKVKLDSDCDFFGEEVCEISRMCVLRPFRGAPREDKLDAVLGERQSKRETEKTLDANKELIKNECAIMLGLIRAVYGYGLYNGVNHFIALMSAPLARILKRNGFSFDVVGDKCEFNGIRKPYYFNTLSASEDFTKMPSECGAFFAVDTSYKLYSDWRRVAAMA